MDTTKILQAILDSQEKLSKDISIMSKRMEEGFDKVNSRIDKLGKQLAYLEDDAPTRDEFDQLEKRISNVESKVVGA